MVGDELHLAAVAISPEVLALKAANAGLIRSMAVDRSWRARQGP